MIATQSFANTITPKLHKLRVVNKIQVTMKNAKNQKTGETNDNHHMDCTKRWTTMLIKNINFSVYMIVNLV